MSLDIWLSVQADAGGPEPVSWQLFSANYTHNVTNMWRHAGCYDALYESHGKQAKDILLVLEQAVEKMHAEPAVYMAMDSPNGWGQYVSALPFLERVAAACREYPKAIIGVSR